MKEYRSLEQKRLAQGLGPDEARRHAELAELVGADPAATARSGFDVNAAAAKLRESLLPAGLRNRPPPTPEVVEPEAIEMVEPEPDPAAAALASAYAEQPFTPLDQPAAGMDFFDPAALSTEPGADGQPAWDPNAQPPYDPNDANAAYAAPSDGTWDPNTQPPYDPNDPNAQPPYDPNDPNAVAYDANAAYAAPADGSWDPAAQLGYDPSDPNATPPDAAAYDPNAAYATAPEGAWDPNAQPPYDPNDPNAAASDLGASSALAWDATPEGGFDPSSLDPDAPPPPAVEPEAAPVPVGTAAMDPTPEVPSPEGPDAWAIAGPVADASAQPLESEAWEAPAAAPAGEAETNFGPAADSVDTQGEWSTLGAGTAPLETWEAGPEPLPADDPYAMLPPDGETRQADPDAPAPAAAPGGPDALGLTPPQWDPTPAPAEPPGEVVLGEYDGAGPASFAPAAATEAGAGFEPGLPFDAAAASAIDPGTLPEGFEPLPGEYDDTTGFAVNGYEAPPTPHLVDEVGHGAAPAWQPDTALDQGFELASGGSFDAKADAHTPQWAGGGEAATPWEGGELTEPEAEPDLGAAPELDRSAPDFSSGDDDFLAVSTPPLALGGPAPASRPAPAAMPGPAMVVSAPPSAVRATARSIPVAPAPPPPRPAPAAPTRSVPVAPPAPPEPEEIPTLEAEEILEPEPLPEHAEEILEHQDVPGAIHSLDFEDVSFTPAPTAASARAPVTAGQTRPVAASTASAPGPSEPSPGAAAPLPAEDVAVEEPPGEDSAGLVVRGVHRVVIHTLEGLVKRGVLEDADLAAPVLGLAAQPGAEPEVLATDRVKAIFFMLAQGETAPRPDGKRVRVTFRDGRQVAGLSPDYRDDDVGFFMIPADSRTNTGRIWIYRAAVKSVAVS